MVGAFGGVGTTLVLGLTALRRGLVDRTGLVTALPLFASLDLAEPEQFIVGGHDIRETSFAASAEEFRQTSGVFRSELVEACRSELETASARVRPGIRWGLSRAIAALGTWGVADPPRSPREAVERIETDLHQFCTTERIDHLIVLNIASTEPPFPLTRELEDGDDLERLLERGGDQVLPASSLYAYAAIRSGYSYINFTPSLGASLPALIRLAEQTGSVLAGKDGKTGETLMKTVLAPMFTRRNLHVMSWVGHNIFGNRDGIVLDDPVNKASKVESKDQVVAQILGYRPKTVVSIEYVPDMGDWKTAWDHIHFEGFLGCRMTLQFTWQGCDSLLAAPLAIDLARLVDAEKRRGGRGLQTQLACFFKSPEGVEENDFFQQWRMLEEHYAGQEAVHRQE